MANDVGARSVHQEEWAALARLWAELAERPLGDPVSAVRLALERLCALMGGSSATVSLLSKCASGGAVRHRPSIADGWRFVSFVNFGPSVAELDRLTEEFLRDKSYAADPLLLAVMSDAGKTRVYLLRDVIDEQTYDETTIGQWQRALGVGDRVGGVVPVGPSVEVVVHIDRSAGSPRFEERWRAVMLEALLGLESWLKRLARSTGLIDASEPLTPREQDVLRLLLTGKVEGVIAAELGMGQRSLHQRVVTIYRKFGVASRPQLMALWLNAARAPRDESDSR